MRQKRNAAEFVATVIATVCLVAACSSSGGTSSSSSGTSGSSSSTTSGSSSTGTSRSSSSGTTLKSELPKQYQDGIQVGLSNDTPPEIFQNSSGKNVGMDLDLLAAAQKVLGVPLTPHSVPFADMLLGLESGKYAFVTDTTINDPRKKIFKQVSNFENSSSFGSLKSTSTIGTSLTDVCGETVGVVTGNNTVPAVTGTIDPACKKAGKPLVTMKQYPDFNTVYVNMKSGNVKLCFVDTGSYGYFLSQPAGSDFRYNGPKDVLKSYNGWSTLNANEALAVVLQKALTEIMSNGQYKEILGKWGQAGVEISKSEINPPTSS